MVKLLQIAKELIGIALAWIEQLNRQVDQPAGDVVFQILQRGFPIEPVEIAHHCIPAVRIGR